MELISKFCFFSILYDLFLKLWCLAKYKTYLSVNKILFLHLKFFVHIRIEKFI